MFCEYRIIPPPQKTGDTPLCGAIQISSALPHKGEDDTTYVPCVRPQCGHECPIYQWSKLTVAEDLEQSVHFIDAYEKAVTTACFVRGHENLPIEDTST
jgi:hypothetical protein